METSEKNVGGKLTQEAAPGASHRSLRRRRRRRCCYRRCSTPPFREPTARLPCQLPLARRRSNSASTLLAVLLAAAGLLHPRTQRGWVVVHAEECSPQTQDTVISSSTEDVSSAFECDNGIFEVTWSGVVNISESIVLGNGTRVSIIGDYDNGLGGLDAIGGSTDEVLSASTSGSSAVETNGVAFGPIFVVVNASLSLDGIAVRNGNASKSMGSGYSMGGGVHGENAKISVVRCEFEDNFAELGGAGISANASDLVVTDTVFRRCRAGSVPEAGDKDAAEAGGGIMARYGDTLVNSSLFEECYASKKGGGVDQFSGGLTVTNSIFIHNSAGSENVEDEDPVGEGGSMSLSLCTHGYLEQGNCSVGDTAFLGSSAASKGGTVQISGDKGSSVVEFAGCLVVNSSAGMGFDDDPQGDGGAFSVGTGVTLILANSTVWGGTAGNKGGAVTLSGGESSQDPGATLVLRNSTFVANGSGGGSGGVLYCNAFSTARVRGNGNVFSRNYSGKYGGVIGATSNTSVTIEGGEFQGNTVDENGGVFWTKGAVKITGGNFYDNESPDRGGVFDAGADGVVTLAGGNFESNRGGDQGGVGFLTTGSTVYVVGGTFSANQADIDGGAFSVEASATFEITGGSFSKNTANFGGFLYKEGSGNTSCHGTSIEEHTGVNGGALYILRGVNVEWQCDLNDNDALAGPAIYALHGSDILLKEMTLSGNTASRASVVFVVGSSLRTSEVVFTESSESAQLSAVQTDKDSTYYAEDTTFEGFGEGAVVFSQGALVLDHCDFSRSSAPTLVFSEGDNATSLIRNTILGNMNYETLAAMASSAEIPTADELVNVNLSCADGWDAQDGSSSSWVCSDGSLCLDGDLGVYCQCYESMFTGEEVCIDEDPETFLALSVGSEPQETYYPALPEGELVLSLSNLTNGSGASSTTDSGWANDDVIWNASVVLEDNSMAWTIFPSTGLLSPGESITLRLWSVPSAEFDGTKEFSFRAEAVGLSTGQVMAAEVAVNVTFYHCVEGSFWNVTSRADTEVLSCVLCTDALEDVEGLDCTSSGFSTPTLPIREGYWRASLSSITIRECYNEDACIGGSAVEGVEDYCATGYGGPFCGVCSSGYGPSTGNSCHRCREDFKIGMIVATTAVALVFVGLASLLAIYLIAGTDAVSSALDSAQQAICGLRWCGLRLIRSGCCVSHGDQRAGTPSDPTQARMSAPPAPEKDIVVAGAEEGRAPSPPLSATQATGNRGKRMVTVSPAAHEPRVRPLGYEEQDSHHGTIGDVSGECLPKSERGNDAGNPPIRGANGLLWSREGHGAPGRDARRVGTAKVVEGDASLASSRDVEFQEWRDVKDEGENGARGTRDFGPARREKSQVFTTIALIGNLRNKLPLSRLKIVIVVWQILTAFSEITQVPMPHVYKRFLDAVGIFTFDLGWIFSAACLTDGLNFYDKLLIITLGPVFMLAFLGLTFYLGARRHRQLLPPPASASEDGSASRGRANELRPTRLDSAVASFREAFGSVPSARPHSQGSSLQQQRVFHEQKPGNPRASEGERQDAGEEGVPTPRSLVPGMVGSRGQRAQAADVHDPSSRSDSNAAHAVGEGRASPASWISRKSGVHLPGPDGHEDPEKSELWWLFARHMTIVLIVFYLIYSEVSTVVFQTFVCQDLSEIGKSYLRADLSLECYTSTHRAYRVYASFMIFIYPLGIPAAFFYFLMRQRSSIDPTVDTARRGLTKEKILLEKLKRRNHDQTVAPTSVLWVAYFPNRYYYEVCECMRRLFLTGLMVFFLADTSGQVAIGCLIAFMSLIMFELLRPHVDPLDIQLYRAGCVVVFFSNFLALMIKAEVADVDSSSANVYAAVLVVVNVLMFLSIFWNIWASTEALFSRDHFQGEVLGFDLVDEERLKKILGDSSEAGDEERDGNHGIERDTTRVAPSWEHPSLLPAKDGRRPRPSTY